MLRQFSLRRAFAHAALCATVHIVVASTPQAQQLEVSGTLHSVWRDPARPGDAPTRLFSVVDDSGRVTPVQLTAQQAEQYGGFDAIRLRRVRLSVAAGQTAAIQEIQPQTSASLALLAEGPRVMRYVTLLCRFPDFDWVNPGTLADAEVMFGQAFPGVGHYWDEASNGQLSLAGGIVRGWYMLPKSRDVYVPADFADLNGLARDCAAAADADVDFSQFEGVNFVFNTNIDCCSYGGTGSLTLDGGQRSYAMTWLASNVFDAHGTIAHEVGHSLGLSHSSGSYGLVYDSRWDVMSSSSWIPVPGTVKSVGSHINAYGKRQLGFIPAARDFVATPGTHEILLEKTARPAANDHYLIARIPTPRFGSNQYYTLEVRGIGGYDAALVGAGVVVHRIGGGGVTPSNVIDPDGDFDPNDDGALLVPGEQFIDALNGITIRVLERVGDAFRLRLDVAESPQVLVEAPQRLYTVTAGADSVIADSALVTLVGMPEGTAWTASKQMSGPLSVLTAAGTGMAMLRWSVRTNGLAAGLYDQNIRVDAGAFGWASVQVRVRVLPPSALTLGVSAPARRDSIIAGGQRHTFNSVVVGGPGADTTSWTVTTSASWITMVQGAGVGLASVQYVRDTEGLTPGMYVAELTLSAPGTSLPPLTLLDSLEVLEPIGWEVTHRGATRTTLGEGALPVLDSMRVELSGRHGTSALWYAVQGIGSYYIRPEFPGPVGSGWVRFRRAPADLVPGVYPATIRLYLAADPTYEYVLADTLVVSAAPVGITLSASVTRDSVRGITSLSEDSVFVQPTGPGSSSRAWRAINTRALLAFPLSGSQLPNQRTGPGWIRFIRNLADRAPGWHVDTLDFLEANGSIVLAKLIDSLYVAPGPVPTTIALAASARRHELRAGGSATLEDTLQVNAAGDDASGVQWTATARASWITLLTPSGTGSSALRWTRSVAGLEPGWYVDTIRIVAPAATNAAAVVDSLRVYAALSVAGAGARPGATMGAAYADTLRTSGGPTAPVTWSIVDGALPQGLTLDAATAVIGGTVEASGTFAVTVRAVAQADTALQAMSITVEEPVLAAESVIEQLLGGGPLNADQRRYLDLQGNRNGRVDIGDVRAWRRRQAAALATKQRAAVDSVVGAAGELRRTP